jgi:hypothetical protein
MAKNNAARLVDRVVRADTKIKSHVPRDLEVPQTRFRGRSHALLYDGRRPHSILDRRTPAKA